MKFFFILALGLFTSFSAAKTASSDPPLATNFPTPERDPFYALPLNIHFYAPGQVIRSRTVQTTMFGNSVNTRQLFYRTTNRAGYATGTVATVFIPDSPASPPRILSYQSPEDSLALKCAPSWASVNSSSELEAYFTGPLQLIARVAVTNNWYVVNSDDEELTSSWLVGKTEGHATLDGIRATINDLALSKPLVALLGYSGGAHQTVWASTLAAGYAPELNIVAAAYGGTPVDLRSNYDLVNGGPEAALAGGALVGLANGYPGLNDTLSTILTREGERVFGEYRTTAACIPATGAKFANYNFSSTKYFKAGNPLQNPVLARILAEESLLEGVNPRPVPVPKFPRYEWHGEADETVPFAPEARYVSQQCAHGANIIFVPYPGYNHSEAGKDGAIYAFEWVALAFNNSLPHVKCGSNWTAPTARF